MNETNHWKLGLFVLGGTALIFALLIWIGASNFDRTTVPAFSYFDESVQGLDVGSSVKFRGVTIGSVSSIGIAQDRRLVEVEFAIDADVMRELGFGDVDRVMDEWGKGRFVPDNVRVSIASAGITGLKFLEVDLFDPENVKPPPELEFEPLWNYVPSTPSTIKGIEESIRQTADSIPALIRDMRRLTESVTRLVDDPQLGELVGASRDLVRTANGKLGGLDVRGLGDDVRTTLAKIDEVVAGLRGAFDGLLDDEGPIAEVFARLDALIATAEGEVLAARIGDTTAALRGATDDARALMTDSRGLLSDSAAVGDDLRVTLATLRATLDALEDLARLLERNPSALLSGKSNP